MNNIKRIIFLFIVWRVFLFLPLYFGFVFIDYRLGYEYTNLWYFIKPYFPVNSFLFFPWANFDGVHYLSIAGDGYNDGTARFFPLYPLIVYVFSSLFGGEDTFGLLQFFTGFFTSNIFLFISLIFFYKLVRLDFNSGIAIKSLFFMLVFPTSFYFSSIYSESLFLLLSLLAFYYARRRQWIMASIFGTALAATRIVGISIFPVLLYEFFTQKGDRKFFKSIPLYFIPFGIFAYMIFSLIKWGNAFYFLSLQGSLSNGRTVDGIIIPFQTLLRYVNIFIKVSPSHYEWWLAILEVLVFISVSLVLYLAFLKKIRFSYILYSLICFLIPVLSGTFSGLFRYVLVLFPIYIVLSLVKRKSLIFVYIATSVILLLILTMLFSRGYYVS